LGNRLEKQKTWFNDCQKLLDGSKEAKSQWLHYPSEINEDNLKKVKCDASRCFSNKKENK
jgi:hypothetical protein